MRESDDRLRRIYLAKQSEDAAYLVGALRDHETRPLAAKFLADLGATESAPAIERLLSARDPHARRASARALGRLGTPSSVPRLREVARDDSDPVTRAWAIASLGAIGGDGALAVISEYLADPLWVVRRGAAFALGLLRNPEALIVLKRAKRAERWSRRRIYREAARHIKHGETLSLDPGESSFERFAHVVVAHGTHAEGEG